MREEDWGVIDGYPDANQDGYLDIHSDECEPLSTETI